MNYRFLFRILSYVLSIEAALLLIPTLVSAIYKEPLYPFLITIGILLLIALPIMLILKPKNERLYAKEGFVCVGLSWILMSVFGALPFVVGGSIPNFIDAFFEVVSGFTTTGASILTAVEGLPMGILFWRSFTHWIGGMGVLVFVLALIPSESGNTIHLMRAEVPGPQKGKLVPKMRKTAIILYGIYIGLSVIMTTALLCTGMPLYDSLVNTFATAGTGGFSVKNASIAAYNNPAAEWVIASFMLIFGINFNLYFFILIKKLRPIAKNEELRVYLLLTVIFTTLIAVNIWNSACSTFSSVEECIRASFFQVTSIMSTSGYSTVDFNLWPEFSKSILLLLMFTGACAGSTAGGLKLSRIIIIFKTIRLRIKKMLKPNTVIPLKLDGNSIPQETGRNAINYLSIYVVILILTTFVISINGFDLVTNLTATVSCFNNVGPGFGDVIGPMGNYSSFSPFSKLVLSFAMLFGRLEIFPMIIMFSPSSWKSHRKNEG